jgi:predicted nuclease of predicted toxin-antitoxin system
MDEFGARPGRAGWHGSCPGSVHVREIGLERVDDAIVWKYAQEHGFAIISKDSDFRQLSFLHGSPPKLIWIRRGNCTTAAIEEILQARFEDLERFVVNTEAAFLALT